MKDFELSDEHYSRYRRPGSPVVAPEARQVGVRPCPEPGAVTVDEEIYWLLVVAQQIGWPLPVAIRSEIAPHRAHRFTIDQIRFLIRKEPRITALHMAIAGVPICELSAIWAAERLRAMQASATPVSHHPIYGAWPTLSNEAERAWDNHRQALYQPDAATVKSTTGKLAWCALLHAQCGWPMPAAITRRFPKFWVTRRIPIGIVAAAFGGRTGMTVADAVLAGVGVEGLTREMLIASVARMVSAPSGAPTSPADDAYGHLCSFFSEEDIDGVDEGLLAVLTVKMRDILTGRDQNKGQRLSFEDFLFWRDNGADPADNPYLRFRVPKGESNDGDESSGNRHLTAPSDREDHAIREDEDGGADMEAQNEAADEGGATDPAEESQYVGHGAATDVASDADRPSQPPEHALAPPPATPPSQTGSSPAGDGSAAAPEDEWASIRQIQRRQPGETPVNSANVCVPPETPPWKGGDDEANNLRDLAILRKRLNLELNNEQQSALPPDFQDITLTPYRIAELMPYRRPAYLDVAWKAFGHEIPAIEGALADLLENQAKQLRADLAEDINRHYTKISDRFPLIRKFNPRWMYEYSFYKRALLNSFDFDIGDGFFINFEYLAEPHPETYNVVAFRLIKIIDFITIAHFRSRESPEFDIKMFSYQTSMSSNAVAKFITLIDFDEKNDDIINSMIIEWQRIIQSLSDQIILSVRTPDR